MEMLWNLFILFLLPVGIVSFILFFVMKAAAEAALEAFQAKREEGRLKELNPEDFNELMKLRDLEVLSDKELEEIKNFYQEENLREIDHAQYKKYKAILKDLRDKGYFSEVQYQDKINRLNENC